MPYSSTKETPYRLVYGSDAMVPIELTELSPGIMTMTEESNELDLAEKDKERVRVLYVLEKKSYNENKKVIMIILYVLEKKS